MPVPCMGGVSAVPVPCMGGVSTVRFLAWVGSIGAVLLGIVSTVPVLAWVGFHRCRSLHGWCFNGAGSS